MRLEHLEEKVPVNLVKAKAYMSAAESISWLATCPRRSVGAIILDADGKSVGFGYNGAPSGLRHCEDTRDDITGCLVLDGHCTNATHAELNVILNGDPSKMKGGTMFLYGAFPCYRCALAMVTVKLSYLWCDDLKGLTEDQMRGMQILIDGKVTLKITE